MSRQTTCAKATYNLDHVRTLTYNVTPHWKWSRFAFWLPPSGVGQIINITMLNRDWVIDGKCLCHIFDWEWFDFYCFNVIRSLHNYLCDFFSITKLGNRCFIVHTSYRTRHTDTLNKSVENSHAYFCLLGQCDLFA